MADERMPARLIDSQEEEDDLDPEIGSLQSVDLGERFLSPLVDTAREDTPDEEPATGD